MDVDAFRHLDVELGLRAQALGWLVGVVLLIGGSVLLKRGRRAGLALPAFALVAHPVLLTASVLVRIVFGHTWLLDDVARLILLLTLARTVYLIVVEWGVQQRLGRSLPRIFGDILQAVVYVAVSLVALRAAGVDPGSLLTTSALLTAVIGLSLQETLGNLFAGLAVQTEKPFAVGDWIQFQDGEDLVGEVQEINWRATRIVTADAVQVVVPNSVLAKAPVRNYSRPARSTRRTVTLQGPYDVAPGVMRRALLEAVAASPQVLTEPPPQVYVHTYADSGIDYQISYFIEDFARRRDCDSDVLQRCWYALQRFGISCPFPVRELLQRQPSPEVAPAASHDRFKWLKGVEFLDVLPEPLLSQLADSARELHVHAGGVIVSEGDSASELYVVISGQVDVMTGGLGESSRRLASLGPGRLFGELGSVAGTKRTASVLARVETTLLVIDYADFGEVLGKSPALRRRLEVRWEERASERDRSYQVEPSGADSALDGALFRRLRELFSLD